MSQKDKEISIAVKLREGKIRGRWSWEQVTNYWVMKWTFPSVAGANTAPHVMPVLAIDFVFDVHAVESVSLFSTYLPERSCYCKTIVLRVCRRGSPHLFYMANILSVLSSRSRVFYFLYYQRSAVKGVQDGIL